MKKQYNHIDAQNVRDNAADCCDVYTGVTEARTV